MKSFSRQEDKFVRLGATTKSMCFFQHLTDRDGINIKTWFKFELKKWCKQKLRRRGSVGGPSLIIYFPVPATARLPSRCSLIDGVSSPLNKSRCLRNLWHAEFIWISDWNCEVKWLEFQRDQLWHSIWIRFPLMIDDFDDRWFPIFVNLCVFCKIDLHCRRFLCQVAPGSTCAVSCGVAT